jgi:hypothetical protein
LRHYFFSHVTSLSAYAIDHVSKHPLTTAEIQSLSNLHSLQVVLYSVLHIDIHIHIHIYINTCILYYLYQLHISIIIILLSLCQSRVPTSSFCPPFFTARTGSTVSGNTTPCHTNILIYYTILILYIVAPPPAQNLDGSRGT